MSSSSHLAIAPEHLLYACVAYTRDEMHAFDTIIAEHSTGSLSSASSSSKTSLLDLPAELLLTIRHHLHRTLTERTRTEAAAALATYEDALLRGLCADCFWWNFDMHGDDVWDWVRNGYKEACQCSGGAPARAPADRTTSEASNRSESKHADLSITSTSNINTTMSASKRQWLDAFVERTYGAGGAWTDLVPSVLASLSCEISGTVASTSPSREELPGYMRASSEHLHGFGPAVVITPLHIGDSTSVALGRVTRELDLESAATATFEKANDGAEKRKRCTMQYAHELLGQQPRTHQADYFQLHGHISCACSPCALLAVESTSCSSAGTASGFSNKNAEVRAFLSAVDVSVRHASTLLSFALVSSFLYLTSMLVSRSSSITTAKREQEA